VDSIRGLTPRALFVISTLLTLVFLAIGNFKDDTGQGGAGPFVIAVVLSMAVSALLLFRLWGGLTGRPAYWGFVLGLLAFLSCVAFWLGLPFVLGVPAIAVAARAGGETRARVGLVLGALGVVLGAVGCVIG
jgi:hypothetical protein